MEEPKPRKASHESSGASGPPGTRAPAKGDSSASDVPRDAGGAAFAGETPARPPARGAADETFVDASPTPVPGKPRLSDIFPKKSQLQPGDVLGRRFEILQVLGEGGMGAVYKAVDRAVDHIVALKLIRPELAEHPAILARFKQELLTARQVTHRNVIRIHDLSEVDGVKFITMEFVEGCDLRKLQVDRGKLPPEEAVEIIRQVCLALDAAHSAGVIHRDLKPQNIMQDKQGRILVMDFGLARSLDSDGMTQTGALLGTFEYMSPEQGMGKQLDQRSDLFAVGLIFYELLTGKLPYKADTAIASLLRRNQERAVPAAELDATIPKGLSDIVSKCLERDPNLRYQSAKEILTDLDAGRGPSLSQSRSVQINLPVVEKRWWYAAGGGLLLLVGLFFAIPKTRHSVFTAPTAGVPISGASGLPSISKGKYVAVLPFRVLGDQSSLGYVAEGLVEAMSAKLFQLKDVRLASSTAAAKTNPKTPLPQVAKELGVNLIVHGTVQGSGDNLRVTVTLDNMNENKLVWSQEFAGVTGDLLTIEDQIYTHLVDALETKPSNEEMAAASSHPTENVEAYNQYLKGRDALSGTPHEKNIQAAMNFFNGALQKDPGFALAYTGLSNANLMMYVQKKDKYWSEKAVEAAKQAARLNDKLPEVHFALGSAFAATGQNVQAIAEQKRALELAPNSDEGYRRLGNAYKANGQKDEALRALEKAVEINPYYWNNLAALGNAYFAFGESDKAIKMFTQVIQLEPNNPAGYNNLGLVSFSLGKYEDSISAFQKALQIEPSAQVYTNLATAYFYLKRYPEALPIFEKAVEMNPEDQSFMGNLADGYRWAGNRDKADAAYEKAIGLAYKQLRVNPRDANVIGQLALYYAKKGDPQQAKDFVKKARAIDHSNVYLIYTAAVVDTIGGRPDDAIKELTSALEKGFSPGDVAVEPEFGPLESRPDFQSMMKRFATKKP